MNNDVELLKKEFKRIKSNGLIKSMREGPTGVGYTFETLLNKSEDQECKPDFNSIELKCKLGYSKSALTLFNCVPMRNKKSAIKYIFENYSHYRYGDKNSFKLFERKVFSNYSIVRYNIEFKLCVDFYSKEIVMKSFKDGNFSEIVCSWPFEILERKLKRKLNYMAIIEAYPYRRSSDVYYKFVKMNIYKLKSFLDFLWLIKNDIIFISFYMKEAVSSNGNILIEDHGVAFKIKTQNIEKLFYKLRK